MDPNRQLWNQQHKVLTRAVARADQHERAVALFLDLHAALHAPEVAGNGAWSLDAELWDGLEEAAARRIPRGAGHSIAWAVWHIARIEDITLNYLVAGTPQLLFRAGWQERMRIAACDTGNAMDADGVARLSAQIDLHALRAYRSAVGQRTREIMRQLPPGALLQPVDPAALAQSAADGAVAPEAAGLLDYWGSKTKGTLLLMPPTRHLLVHLNQAARLKARRG